MEHPEEREPSTVITSDTDNATTIQPKEAPPEKQAKFRRFRAYNTGMWNGPKRENTESFRRQDNLHRFDALSSTLDLNRFQRKRGRKVLDDLDVRRIGKTVDSIIFAICVLVANADLESGTRYHPHPNASDDAGFEKVAAELDLDQNQQTSIIEMVRAQTNF